MRFMNPTNNYIEERSAPWLWAFLFGGLYFLVSGYWLHFFIWLVVVGLSFAIPPLPILTVPLMAIIYAVMATDIVKNNYRRNGWIEVQPSNSTMDMSGRVPFSNPTHRKCPFCAEQILFEAVKCKHCGSDLGPEASDSPASIDVLDNPNIHP